MAHPSIDPTFYRSLGGRDQSHLREKLADVVAFDRAAQWPDALVRALTSTSASAAIRLRSPAGPTCHLGGGNELHHFGWNACSSAVAHAGSPHSTGCSAGICCCPGCGRRTSMSYDTHPDPGRSSTGPDSQRGGDLAEKAGYSRPHTLHCGPGRDLPVLPRRPGTGPTAREASPCSTTTASTCCAPGKPTAGGQYLAYDAWWHLSHNTMITSERGTPTMIEDGINPELLLGSKYGHEVHIWDLPPASTADGRPGRRATDGPGTAAVPRSRPDLGFRRRGDQLKDFGLGLGWSRRQRQWGAEKVIEIPAEPAEPIHCRPLLKGFGSGAATGHRYQSVLDDRTLYAACRGTGELRQYDVSDPAHPRLRPVRSMLVASLAGARTPHSSGTQAGGPQMVELSRDGKRVYSPIRCTGHGTSSSIRTAWAPGSPRSTLDPSAGGGLRIDEKFFPHGWTSAACACTRSAAGRRLPLPTPTAIADSHRTNKSATSPNRDSTVGPGRRRRRVRLRWVHLERPGHHRFSGSSVATWRRRRSRGCAAAIDRLRLHEIAAAAVSPAGARSR